MKIKSISLSFFILASLIISSFAFYAGAENTTSKNIFLDSDGDGLSNEEEKIYGTNPVKADTDGDGYSDGAEVRSGYDPTKPAPGDRLVELVKPQDEAVLGDTSKKNLTNEVAQKLSELTEKSTAENTQISLDDLQIVLDPVLDSTVISEDELPEISEEDLKIKAQKYGKLSEEKAQAKKKEDCLEYLTAITYIFTSNSPEPITKIPDITKILSIFTKMAISAITSQSASGLQDFLASQEKIAEQLKAVEVPEDLVSLHIKALRFVLYSEKFGTLLEKTPDDPLTDIANFSKLDGFISAFTDFTFEAQAKLSEYDLTYDETVQKRIENLGLDAPDDLSELESILNLNTAQ